MYVISSIAYRFIFLYNIVMKKLIVEEKYNLKSLQNYILKIFPNLSQNLFFKTLRKKDIKINGIRVSQNVCIHTGDTIEIYVSDELLLGKQVSYESLYKNRVYEDDNIVILNKPSKIEVLGTDSMTSILQKKFEFIYPCHRLDRNTQGLILFAKNKTSLEILFSKFKQKEIEKHYLAICYHIPKEKQLTLHSFLFKDAKKARVYISPVPKKGYMPICTSYSVKHENEKKNICLLDVQIETGRTHQIRAQLADIGLPIIGDEKYGSYEANRLFHQKEQLLWNYSLQFHFSTDAGMLNYLNHKSFAIPSLLENIKEKM